MILTPVERELVPLAWLQIEPWIVRACERVPSELTVEGLRNACLDGKATLILIGPHALYPVAAGVIEIRTRSDGSKAAWILALGGSGLREWRDTLKLVEESSKAQGCHTVEFVGRPGWARALPGYDCNVHFRKAL
jgi:hypothetical protein